MHFKAFALSLAVLALTACGKPDAGPAELSDSRQKARDNALFNAQRFRQENTLFSGWTIIPRGDSTQSPSCPQGDGWATLEFVSPDRSAIRKVKCSTFDSALGCLEDDEFKKKEYSGDDGHCQPVTKVPYPLPSLAK